MSEDSVADDKSILENNLRHQLLKGCCQVFQRQNGREIAVLGCLAVTIKSHVANVSPLVYFVHLNQILTEQDYKTSAAKTADETRSNAANANGSENSTIRRDIKSEPDATPFSTLPTEMIPPGKGFVVKTQTVYEKTADGEERKVSVSTQGLIDTCDMKTFAGHPQGDSGFKQEPQDCQYQEEAYYEGCYDQAAYENNGTSAGEYDQAYAGNEYYETDYEAQPQRRPKKKTLNKARAAPNVARKKAAPNFKNRFSGQNLRSSRPVDEQYHYDQQQQQQPQHRPKAPRHSFGRAARGLKLGRASHDPSNPYVVTRSMHECGYPGCGKRFKWKQHLLRHQTEKHGRVPSKKLAFEKVLVRNPNYQRQTNNNYCTTVSAEEDDYYEAEEYAQQQEQAYADSQEYYYE